MASNTTLNVGASGDVIATKERTHDGDATKVQVVTLAGVAGTEGSYTFGDIGGDSTNGLDVDVTRTNIQGNVDTAAGATQIGVAALAVRDDALATLTEADADLTLVRTNARGATWVALDSTAAQTVTLAAGTATNEVVGDAAHDAAAAGNPVLVGAYASAAAPTDVSGDADAVRLWALRSGALAVQPTLGGVLATAGNGAAGTGVARVTIASDSTGNIATIGTSVTPGTSAAHLGKAEDAAHASGDTGVMALAVRRDADTTLAATDGDYVPLQCNAAGSLKVAITAGAGSGGTSIADGASFTRDTTSVTPVGAVVETSAPTLTNGDAAGLSMTTGGALRVAVASGGIAGVVEDAAAAGGEEGIMVLAVRRDTAASSSGTDGDFSTLNTDANGRLHTIAALAASQTLATVTTVTAIGTSVTPGTSAAHLGKAEDAAHTSGDTGVMSLGVRSDSAAATSGTTGDYEPFHTDSVGAVWTRSTGELADDAAFTPATSRVLPVGFLADETATDSVDEGDVGAARITLDRKQIVASYAHAAGGATPGRLVSAASTNGTVVKASAATLYSLVVMNLNAAVRYLKVYNSTSVTVGTTTPTWTFPIPASTTGAGFNVPIPACGIAFGTGLCLGMTTGIADNDTGAVAANEIVANYAYA